ncbi:putative bacteriocin [Bacteriovorax sp. BSW11_IV]|uniref:S8 family peptidase n=1 Tax=Bacteriovorax sp. BSW11_IV TaxID=1353529 RepID=UPI000389EB70|nr:S8 family peptidase [Bacteriovorax sp. BSW11_IV]EQC50136.1 putative bacteriocin [Bacteriovorax sp. BSW11_IV]
MLLKKLTCFKTLILAGSIMLSTSGLAVDASHLDLNQLKSKYSSWGIDPDNKLSSINLPEAWKHFSEKKEVVVAVIDTGIDYYHSFLKDNLYVPAGKVGPANYGVDFSKNRVSNSRPSDDHGHGTHVSGIIKSIFPKVKILALKYYDRNASGKDNLKSTIDALRYAVEQNVDIINYSGGGPKPDTEELEILKKAEAKGILVVAAAGNEESNIDLESNAYYPASYDLKNIITVTAYDQNLRVLSSSNYGKRAVDISAPGYQIKSALPSNRSGYLTGTSQATAFVTGVASMIKSQFPDLSSEQIIDIINKSAKKEFTLEGKCATGGRLDATKAQQLASEMTTIKVDDRKVASKTTTPAPGKIIYRVK